MTDGPRDSRRHPTRPVIGVGGAVIDGDRVLLIKRAQPPRAGTWTLPGGAVELGETLETAVAREVHEETGLTVVVGPVVAILDRIHRDATGRIEYHFVLVDYLCAASGGTLEPRSDATDVRWVPASELQAYGVSREARQVIAKAFDLSGFAG